MMTDSDPFIAEARRHGWSFRMRDSKDHGALRDRIRESDCPSCVALIAQWDAVLMGAMIDGIGPWAATTPESTPETGS